LATQLGISGGILAYCLLQFEWNRRRKSMTYLYSPRTKLSKNASPPIPPGLFSWIKVSLSLDEEFYLKNVGLDAVMYIRFLKMAFQFLLFNVLIVGPILLPINYYAGGTNEGVAGLSISNIPSGIKDPLWAHTICTYLVSLSWMYLLYKNYCDYIDMFRQHLLNRVKNDPITARTVMVSRIPPELRTEEKLREFVEKLGLGPVESTRMVRHIGKLDRKIKRREEVLLALEKAHIQLAKKCETKEHQRIQSIVEWLDVRKRKRTNNIGKQVSSDQDNFTTRNATVTTASTFTNEDIMEQEDGYVGFMGSGKSVLSIDHFIKKFNYLNRRIAELRSLPINATPYKATSTGFVTFRDHISAQLCAQSIMYSKPHTCTTKMAPEPRDLLWDNLFMRFREKMIRTVIVNICVWALTLFWLFPIVAFLTLTSIDSLSRRIQFLGPFLEAAPIIRTLLQNVLPTVLVSFFMAILPWILMELSKQEYFPSYSALEEAVLVRHYYFTLFNVFVVFLLGITFLQSIFDVINSPTSIFEVLAISLPQGATFFINYVIFNTCTHGLELVQVGSQIFLHIILTSRFVATTPLLVITITYSTINPLILVFALIYYAIALLVFKHQFAYCYVRRYESGGKLYRRVFKYTTDGLIIFQITVIGMIWLRTAIVPGAFLIPLLIGTGYFKYYCHKTFYSRTHFLALDTRLEVDQDGQAGVDVQTEKPITQSPKLSQDNDDLGGGVSTKPKENTEFGVGSMFGRKSTSDGFRRLETISGNASEGSTKDNVPENNPTSLENRSLITMQTNNQLKEKINNKRDSKNVLLSSTENPSRFEISIENPEQKRGVDFECTATAIPVKQSQTIDVTETSPELTSYKKRNNNGKNR
ncbi:14330_t:CDS:2, partial [Acaulospora morrowiae]